MKNLMTKFNRFCILLDLFVHIWKNGKSERFIQYLTNRIPPESDLFYVTDEWFLNYLRQKDEELKYEQNNRMSGLSTTYPQPHGKMRDLPPEIPEILQKAGGKRRVATKRRTPNK